MKLPKVGTIPALRVALPRSLRGRLLLLFGLLALAPLLLVGGIDVIRSRRYFERMVAAQTDSVARRVAQMIARHADQVESDRNLLSGNTETQRLLRAAASGDSADDVRAVVPDSSYFADMWLPQMSTTYTRIEIRGTASGDGEAVLALPDLVKGKEYKPDDPPTEDDSLQRASNVLRLRYDIRDAQDTAVRIGELLLFPNLSVMIPSELLTTGFGETAQTLVIDTDAERVIAPRLSRARDSLSRQLALRALLLSTNRRTVTFGSGDSLRLASVVPVDGVPWVVVSSTALSEFTNMFAAQRASDVLFLIVLSVAVGLAFLVLVRRATRSFEDLTAAARAVGRGDLTPKLPPTGDDEVSDLGATFSEMTQRLRVMVRDLEVSRQLAVLGEYSAQLSHEIRNPLTSLQLELQGLIRDVRRGTLGDDAERSLQTCLREVRRLDRVAHGAVALGRPRESERVPANVILIISQARAAMLPELEQRGIAFEERIEALSTAVTADAEALQGAIINLLRNSADAQPQGGRILVSVRNAYDADGFGWIHIVVADDGPGIPAHVADRIFRPFVTSKPEGTGLGLPMAMRVAHEHGGNLTLTSADPSWNMRGAAFCLALPLASSAAAAAPIQTEVFA